MTEAPRKATTRTWVGPPVLVLALLGVPGAAIMPALSLIRKMFLDGAAPSGLPGGVLDAAKETLASALLYAQELPATIGAALATAATESFTTALAWTGGIAALILLGVSVFAGLMLRGVSAQADLANTEH